MSRMMIKNGTPYLGMILAQFAQVGLIIVSKKAMANGMTNFTFIFYSNALASLILLPLSLLIHRRSTRPPLNFSLICGFFLLGILGCSAQITGYAGINYTSASFASAMLNLIPGFTFVLAVIFRLEKVDFSTSSTIGKSIGTILSIVGAFILTLYKGPQIMTSSSSSTSNYEYIQMQQSDWVVGGLLLTLDCVASSAFIIVQAIILNHFPAELIIVFFYCFFAAILSAALSLIVEKDLSSWNLQPSVRLLAVLYSGVFGSAFQVGVISWCLHKMGPLFVAMFHPLGIVIAAILGVIFLQEGFYLGSLVGSVIIVFGFYAVMWGKAKEVNKVEDVVRPIDSYGESTSLLKTMSDDAEA